MLTKRIVSVLIICCLLITGCSFQKTDTSELRANGVSSATSQLKSADRILSGSGAEVLLAVANGPKTADDACGKDFEASENGDMLNTSADDLIFGTPAEIYGKSTEGSVTEPEVLDQLDGTDVGDLFKEETIISAAEYVEGEVRSYNSKLDDYLASLGTTLEDAKKQAEENRKAEQAILDEIKNKEKQWDDLAPTTHMSFEELIGDNGVYEYPEAFPTPDTYKIVVDLKYQVVMVFARDEKGKYTVPVRYMLCSSGADKTQSPVGTFEMKDYRVRFSRFKNTDNFGQYWSLITGRIYFHSVLYTSKNASDYVSSTWNNLGKNVSHGCIRLSVPDARFIYYNMAPGTVVEIRKGSSSDKETKKIREKLLEGKAEVPSKRLKLVAGEIPYTDNWSADEVPHEVPFVNGHQ